MGIEFGRDICGDLAQAGGREWLVTNGIGGYASGTVAGLLSRSYHGLLVAALQPPLGRTLLLTKLDETASYDGRDYPLFANRWASGAVDPAGYRHLETWRLDGAIPVWTFALGDAQLEKRVFMRQGENTTYILYTLRRAARPLTLSLKALVNTRDHHGGPAALGGDIAVTPVSSGLQFTPPHGATPFYLLSDRAQAAPAHDWYRDFFLAVENERGLNPLDQHLYAGQFTVTLQPGETVTLAASAEPGPSLDGMAALVEREQYEAGVAGQAGLTTPGWVAQLLLAADQFIVRRSLPGAPDGRSVIAGYPWFGDWGRDTMIALPGLTLATERPDVAASILRTFAHYVDQGMLPNRFPDAGEAPEYNTVDATLWYFEAIRAYHAATDDDGLLADLFPVLADIIAWHRRGTRYRIHVDPADGLLYSGEPGVQLTWMDARVDGREITPRTGKAVEINALWYNALRCMASFARRLEGALARATPTGASSTSDRLWAGQADEYDRLADQARRGFARFWNASTGYLYDVVGGPDGDDASLRPNQLLAVSLPYSPLDDAQARAVVDICARRLLTSHGLRSLADDDPAYIGHYGGDYRSRDGAYHQGTVWAWLIGPFVSAHLRVYHDPALARSFLTPLVGHLTGGCVGSLSEIFDGDPPHSPAGAMAQAWSVAEALRVWREIEEVGSEGQE